MEIFRFVLHYGMHYLLPFIIALVFFRNSFWKAGILILSANLIDLDHLMSSPVFDANRCSIGFHILHSYFAIIVYFVLLIPKTTRYVAIGLILHILTDYIDCLWI